MESTPTAPFKVAEPNLLLELLIVALDPPTQIGNVDQSVEADAFGEGREPISGRLAFALGPLDEQPLFGMRLWGLVTMPDAHPHARKARREPRGRTFPPLDGPPGLLAHAESKLLGRDQIDLAAATVLQNPRAGRLWRAGQPHQGARLNAGHVR